MYFKYILEFWFVDLIRVIWIFLLFSGYFFSMNLMTAILKRYLFKNFGNSGKWESNFTFFHEYIKGKEIHFFRFVQLEKTIYYFLIRIHMFPLYTVLQFPGCLFTISYASGVLWKKMWVTENYEILEHRFLLWAWKSKLNIELFVHPVDALRGKLNKYVKFIESWQIIIGIVKKKLICFCSNQLVYLFRVLVSSFLFLAILN